MQTAAGAAKAYASLARLATGGAGTDSAKSLGKVAGDQSFGNMVKDALGQVAQSARGADGQAQAMAAGKANVVDVVTAVAESEVAVDALVAVRDRVIAAYEEIMRMPI